MLDQCQIIIYARLMFMTTVMGTGNNHIIKNFSDSSGFTDTVIHLSKYQNMFLLGEKIMHPEHCSEAENKHTDSTSSFILLHSSTVNALPLQAMRDIKSPKN